MVKTSKLGNRVPVKMDKCGVLNAEGQANHRVDKTSEPNKAVKDNNAAKETTLKRYSVNSIATVTELLRRTKYLPMSDKISHKWMPMVTADATWLSWRRRCKINRGSAAHANGVKVAMKRCLPNSTKTAME